APPRPPAAALHRIPSHRRGGHGERRARPARARLRGRGRARRGAARARRGAYMMRAGMLPIFLIVLVDVFGLTLVIPLLATYAATRAAPPLQPPLLISVSSLCRLVSGPLLGRISDRTGRKKMLLVSQAGTFVGFLLMARAEALWVLYAARVIDGLTAGNLSLAQAWIADPTPPEHRTRALPLLGIALGAGFFVGP